jgi:hypothetical protein
MPPHAPRAVSYDQAAHVMSPRTPTYTPPVLDSLARMNGNTPWSTDLRRQEPVRPGYVSLDLEPSGISVLPRNCRTCDAPAPRTVRSSFDCSRRDTDLAGVK